MGNDLDMRPMVEAMKKATQMPVNKIPGFGWGKVKSISPLVIISTNGLEITEDFLCKSPFCEEWTTKRLEHLHKYNVKHYHLYDDHDTGEGSGGSRDNVHTSTEMEQDRDTQNAIPTFTFWRGLNVGDKVCYLRINDSQMFVLLWRDNQFDLEV